MYQVLCKSVQFLCKLYTWKFCKETEQIMLFMYVIMGYALKDTKSFSGLCIKLYDDRKSKQ